MSSRDAHRGRGSTAPLDAMSTPPLGFSCTPPLTPSEATTHSLTTDRYSSNFPSVSDGSDSGDGEGVAHAASGSRRSSRCRMRRTAETKSKGIGCSNAKDHDIGEDGIRGSVIVAVETASAKPAVTPTPIKQLSLLAAVLLSEAMSASSLFPYVGMYTGHLLDLSVNEVGTYSGLVVAVFTFGQLVSAALWGFVSDRYGRKVPMMIGLVAGTIACFLFGLAPNFAMCCILRFIHGFFNGNVMIAKTIIADITDSTNEAKGFAVMSLTWALGCLIGPGCGGLLYDPMSQGWMRWMHVKDGDFLARYPAFLPNLFLSVYTIIATVICSVWLEESNKKSRSLYTILPVVVQLKLAEWFSCFAPLVDKSLRTERSPVITAEDEVGGPTGAQRLQEDRLEEELVDPVVVTFGQAFHDPTIRRVVELVVLIGASDTAFEETLPLWCIATVSVGGLALPVSQVAVIIASYCIPTFIANFAFSNVCDLFGDQLLLFRFCAYSLTVTTVLIPLGSSFGMPAGYWYVLLVGLFRQAVLSWAFGLLSMFTARCAPKGAVGQLFGLTQTASCAGRSIVPIGVTIVFAWSISESRSSRPFPFNHYFVFVLCSILTLTAGVLTYLITFRQRECPKESNNGEANTGVASPMSPRSPDVAPSRDARRASSCQRHYVRDHGSSWEGDEDDGISLSSEQSVLHNMMTSSYAGAMASLNASFAQGAALAVELLHDEDQLDRDRRTIQHRRRRRRRERRRRSHRARLLLQQQLQSRPEEETPWQQQPLSEDLEFDS